MTRLWRPGFVALAGDGRYGRAVGCTDTLPMCSESRCREGESEHRRNSRDGGAPSVPGRNPAGGRAFSGNPWRDGKPASPCRIPQELKGRPGHSKRFWPEMAHIRALPGWHSPCEWLNRQATVWRSDVCRWGPTGAGRRAVAVFVSPDAARALLRLPLVLSLQSDPAWHLCALTPLEPPS